MSYTGFRATGRNATTARPVDKPQAVAGATWFKDRSSAGADDGTDVDATWLNRLRANLENLVSWLGGAGNTGDSQLVDAFTAKFASAAAHVHDDRYYTEAEIDEALEAIDAAIALKAPLASPTFTGTPAAPTAAQGTNTTQLATTAFVVAEVAASGGSGRTEISRSTVSSGQSSVEFNGTWTSYKALLLVATGVSGSAIAGVSVSLSDDNGSTYKPVTGVQAHSLSITYVTASGTPDTTATTTMLETAALNSSSVPVLASQSAATVNGNFSVQIEDIATLAIAKHVATLGSSQTSGLMQQSVGQTASMGAVNRVKIAATTGNIDAGTFILYGIK